MILQGRWGFVELAPNTIWHLFYGYSGWYLATSLIPRNSPDGPRVHKGLGYRFNLVVGLERADRDIANGRWWRWKPHAKLVTVPAWMDEPSVAREVQQEQLQALFKAARQLPPMTQAQQDRQRESFVWGNTKLHNPTLTREQFDTAMFEHYLVEELARP